MYNSTLWPGLNLNFWYFGLFFSSRCIKHFPSRTDDPEIRKPCANRQARKEIRELEFDYRHFKRYTFKRYTRGAGAGLCCVLSAGAML
jgi:hypothetical protein